MTKRWNEKDRAYYNAQRRLMTELATHSNKPVEFTIGRSYTFIVAGEAIAGGSKKAFALYDKKKKCNCGPVSGYVPLRRPNGSIIINVTPDNDARVTAWRSHVVKVARSEYSGPVFTGFLRVTWIFYQPRPQCHYTSTGRMSKQGLETPWPNIKPDTTKLVRAAEDALRSICYSDDAIIVKQIAEKEYGTPARMEVTIDELLPAQIHEQPVLFEAPAPWDSVAKGEY